MFTERRLQRRRKINDLPLVCSDKSPLLSHNEVVSEHLCPPASHFGGDGWGEEEEEEENGKKEVKEEEDE